MLERPALILSSWAKPAEVRQVLDAATREPLGIVQRSSPSGWRLWSRRPSLEVLETEDKALLFSTYPPGWLIRGWTFYDAEDQFLGGFSRGLVHSGAGEWLAKVEPFNHGGRLVGLSEVSLCAFEPLENTEWRLQFTQGQVESPFRRMTFLGTVLAWLEIAASRV